MWFKQVRTLCILITLKERPKAALQRSDDDSIPQSPQGPRILLAYLSATFSIEFSSSSFYMAVRVTFQAAGLRKREK